MDGSLIPPEIEIYPPGDGLIYVTAIISPFSADRIFMTMEAGCTLAEIIAKVQPDPILSRFAHAAIGDQIILRENHRRVRPRPGGRVTIRMLPGKQKSSGGGKNPLATILTIVTVVAAIALPPLAVGALGLAAGSTAALVTGGLLAGGIMIAGGMLSNALAPPSKPKLAALMAPVGSGGPAAQDAAESPTLSITGARNDLRPYSPVAVVLGRHWQVPALGAPTYTEVVGNDQYLHMIVVWGVGPMDVIDRKIGETPLHLFQDVQRDFRRGYQTHQITDKGGWNPQTGVFPVAAEFGDRWTATTADSQPGIVQGLTFSPWDTITFNALGRADEPRSWDVNEHLPLTLFPFAVVEVAEQIILGMDFQIRTTAEDCDQISFDLVYFRGLTRYDDQGLRQPHTATMYASYAPAGTGAWVDLPIITNTAATAEAVRTGARVNVPRGQYDVRWRREAPASTDNRIIDDCAMTALRSTTLESPFEHRGIPGSDVGICCEAFRIRATDQLQGVVDTLSGICISILPDWNGTAWKDQVTINPASLFRAVFQGAGNPAWADDSEMDLPALQHWHEFCTAKNLSFSHVVDYDSSVVQIASDIAASAFASMSMRDSKISVVIDEPAPFPVQVFTPRNSWGFRCEITYPDLPHAYRVRFVNSNTGKGEEILVFDDGYTSANARMFEVLQLTGVTDRIQAHKLGRYHLAVARLRRQTPSFYADFESIVCTRGDLIRFVHDVPLWGLTAGAVVDVITENGWVVGVQIDEPVTMEPGRSYTIRFRRASAVAMEQFAAVTWRLGLQNILTLTPIPAIGGEPAISKGDLYWFGETGEEHRNLRVHAIVDPSSDHSVRLICVEDNAAIYLAEHGTIPPYDPGISSGFSILFPRIISMRSDGTVVFRSPNGNYDNRILIVYSLPSGTMAPQIQGVEAAYRPINDEVWRHSPVSPLVTGDISLRDVDGHETYHIMLRFVRKDGTRGAWSPVETHTVVAQDGVPPDVPYFMVTRMPDGTRRLEWRMVLEPEDVIAGGGYRIRHQAGTSFTWETATPSFTTGLLRHSPYETNDISPGVWTLGIKAVTASGIESTSATTMTVELGDPRLADTILQRHEHIEGWPGSKGNCFLWGGDPKHLYAAPAAGSLWYTQPTWEEMGTWDSLPRVTPITYTTLVLDPASGNNVTFTPNVAVDADGDITVEMRTAPSSYGSDLSALPWGPIAQASQSAYVQIRVTADGPRIRLLIITLDSKMVVDDIEDINTVTSTASYFQRLGVGWFRVAARRPMAAITGGTIRAIQTTGTGWTWTLASKTASVAGNPYPAAEFRIYDGGIAADALVDIELKGPMV